MDGNLDTIKYLVETVERLTKEGTTYKVELEHTKERVTALEGENTDKDQKIHELEARVSELEAVLASMGKVVNVNTNNGIIGDDVKDNQMTSEQKEVKKPKTRKKGGKDAGDGDKQ